MLFKKEFLSHIKSSIILLLTLFLISYMGAYEFKTMNIDNAYTNLIDSLPKIVKAIFGFGDYSFASIDSLYALLMLYSSIAVILYAMTLGSNVTSALDLEYDMIYLKKTRKDIFIKKVLSNILTLSLIISLNTLFSILIFKDYINIILISNLNLFLTTICFYFISSLISSILNKSITLQINAIIVVFFYILSIIVSLTSNIDFIIYINPLNQIINTNILNGDYNYIYQIVVVFISFIIIYPTYYIFNKKDL